MLARTFKLIAISLLISVVLTTTVLAQSASTVKMEDFTQERKIGNDNAPVKVIEYFSFTCSHCADFAVNSLPTIKKDLVATGKVQFIFRDLPLEQFSLRASLMSRCAPVNMYADILEMIFNSQERWINSKDPQKFLMQLGSLIGMSEDDFNSCIENKDFQKKVIDETLEAKDKYNITGVPTFVLNDGEKIVEGYKTSEQFKKIVEELIKK